MEAKKAIVQLCAAMAAAALPLVNRGVTGELSPSELINVAVAMAGAGSVYIAKNLEDEGVWAYTKAIFAALAFALTLTSSFVTDGIQAAEWSQIVVAFIGALGVALVSNDTDPDLEDAGRHRAEEL
jgi:hypothetical protein